MSTTILMHELTCKRCGDEIMPWMYSEEPDVCTSCYTIDDRERFAYPEDKEHNDPLARDHKGYKP